MDKHHLVETFAQHTVLAAALMQIISVNTGANLCKLPYRTDTINLLTHKHTDGTAAGK